MLSLPTGQASYVSNGTLVILRSQYIEDHFDISIDGDLDEEAWTKAGSITVNYGTVSVTSYFSNSNDYFYFGVHATGLNDSDDGLILTFDTDGDASLDSPEDGVLVNGSSINDIYWDGSNWVADQIEPGESDDLLVETASSSSTFTVEIAIKLAGDNVAYDGFRVADPSNTFIGFNVRLIQSTILGTQTYDFPTTPSNGTGYVDLKLAGAEDQDLPEFIPPETFQNTDNDDPQYATALDTLAAEANAGYVFLAGLLCFAALNVIRRRHLS